MPTERFEMATARLSLRPWLTSDRSDFARMNADPEVMADLGGPLSSAASDEKLERFIQAFDTHGITRWVVADRSDRFLGYCGIVPWGEDHPLGAHHEIGWRLIRRAWGHGYATEAASAALADAFDRCDISEVLAYTSADNVRSQQVMTRLELRRDRSLDFTEHYDGYGMWRGLVWVATADMHHDAWTSPSRTRAPAEGTRRRWGHLEWRSAAINRSRRRSRRRDA
jgi:RimJ/RimL family protein N-acetyltransferase